MKWPVTLYVLEHTSRCAPVQCTANTVKRIEGRARPGTRRLVSHGRAVNKHLPGRRMMAVYDRPMVRRTEKET